MVPHALLYDSLSLLIPAAASAQQAPCAALPTKPPVPTGTTPNQAANRAALAAVLKSPDLAAKKLVFAQQLAKLDSDPAALAQRANNRKQFGDLANGPDHRKQPLQMASQVAAAQSSNVYQNKKAAFQADAKCATP